MDTKISLRDNIEIIRSKCLKEQNKKRSAQVMLQEFMKIVCRRNKMLDIITVEEHFLPCNDAPLGDRVQ